MLSERIDVILRYLRATAANEARAPPPPPPPAPPPPPSAPGPSVGASRQVPADHNLLRQIKSLCTQLPALDTSQFRDEFVQDHSNTLLITYLGVITQCSGVMSEVVEKFNLAYDKHSRRRGLF